MGGMTSLHLAVRLQDDASELGRRFAGVCAIAPAVWQTLAPSMLQVQSLRLVRLLGFGQSALGPELDREAIFDSDESYQRALADPLVYSGRMRLDTGSVLLDMSERTQQLVAERTLNCALGIFHGSDDR